MANKNKISKKTERTDTAKTPATANVKLDKVKQKVKENINSRKKK